MTAALKTNTYDLGDGTVPDSTNTATTGNAVTLASSITTVPASPPTGVCRTAAGLSGQGLRTTAVDPSDVQSYQWTQTANLNAVAMIAFKIASGQLPTNGAHCIARWRSAAGNQFKLVINPAGVLSVQTGAGAGLKNFNSNTKLADGWYYASVLLQVNSTTAASGSVTVKIYDATTATVVNDGTYTSSAIDLGTTGITIMQWGKPEGSTAAGAIANGFDLDNPSFDVGTTTMLVPSVAAITANLVVSPSSGAAPLAVTATASGAAGGTGTTYMYSFDFGDGSGASTPATSTTANHTYSPGDSLAHDYTVSLFVTKV